MGSRTIFSFVIAMFLSKIFQIDRNLISSLLPQSVTTAIAISLSDEYQGIIGLTAIAVVIRGVSGAVFAPLVMKIFKIKDPVAQGVAIGTSSHAVGTSQARLMGKVQGAMSGLSIAVAGITAVIIMPLAMKLAEFII